MPLKYKVNFGSAPAAASNPSNLAFAADFTMEIFLKSAGVLDTIQNVSDVAKA